METMKIYLFEEHEEIKAVIVAKNINEAMMQFQGFVNKSNENEEFTQALHLINGYGRADYQIEVYENYNSAVVGQILTKDMVSMVLDVFEFDFVVGRIYGNL